MTPPVVGVMVGLAATRFALAREHFVAGVLALNEAGFEVTDEFADIIDGVLFVEEEIVALADVVGHAAAAASERRAA
jgi:hypothetical protein